MLIKELIQEIIGVTEEHQLKKYVLIGEGEIMESSLLTYDDFMKCYGILSQDNVFEVVSILKESDDYDELDALVGDWIVC